MVTKESVFFLNVRKMFWLTSFQTKKYRFFFVFAFDSAQ